jgi:hypothetical protein
MTISIMQPGYLPWLGFFELMENCNLFVFLDDVQYTKKDWRNRNRIRTQDEWIWLTVPVLSKGRNKQLIKDAEIDNSCGWSKGHLSALKINYANASYYRDYIGFLEDIYRCKWRYIADLDMEIISFLNSQFHISTPTIKSSSLCVVGYTGNMRILEICRRLEVDRLYDSAGARTFIDLKLFGDSGIRVVFQEYFHPVYSQVYQPFLPYMSAVDLLFNEGPESKNIILSGSRFSKSA